MLNIILNRFKIQSNFEFKIEDANANNDEKIDFPGKFSSIIIRLISSYF